MKDIKYIRRKYTYNRNYYELSYLEIRKEHIIYNKFSLQCRLNLLLCILHNHKNNQVLFYEGIDSVFLKIST